MGEGSRSGPWPEAPSLAQYAAHAFSLRPIGIKCCQSVVKTGVSDPIARYRDCPALQSLKYSRPNISAGSAFLTSAIRVRLGSPVALSVLCEGAIALHPLPAPYMAVLPSGCLNRRLSTSSRTFLLSGESSNIEIIRLPMQSPLNKSIEPFLSSTHISERSNLIISRIQTNILYDGTHLSILQALFPDASISEQRDMREIMKSLMHLLSILDMDSILRSIVITSLKQLSSSFPMIVA